MKQLRNPSTEAELLACVRSSARWLGLAFYHTRDSRGSDPGFPDCVIAGPGGVLFRELKSETGRITASQAMWLQKLRHDAGADAKVWQPGDWPDLIMRELRRLAGATQAPRAGQP